MMTLSPSPPCTFFMDSKKKQDANQIPDTPFFRNYVLIISYKRTDWESEIHM